MQIRADDFDDRQDSALAQGAPSQGGDLGSIELTPELTAELLDPESWGTILGLYARTMRLAVALIDANGRLVGICHNPQPIWSLARKSRPDRAGCLFCLETSPGCGAALDALQTKSLTMAHDQAGLAHVAMALTLGERHVGTLLAGQVLDRYPEALPLQRLAREFALSPQEVWYVARRQPPVSRANLLVYGELLWALGQTVLRARYGAILERRLTEKTNVLNQKLAAVNSTLNGKVAELDQSYSDLQNLFDNTEIATIFLDRQLRVKKFATAGSEVVRLEAGDIGRDIAGLGDRFGVTGVVESITGAAKTLSFGSSTDSPVVREQDLTGAHGDRYLMRIVPYRTARRVIDGVVITFVDVTALKTAEQHAENARVYAENIVATVRQPLLVLDDHFRIQSANQAFYEKFQTTPDETGGQLLYKLGDGQWDIPELRRLFNELLPRDQWVRNFEMEHDFLNIGPRTMLLNARRIDHVELILLAIEDITERKLSEKLLRKLNLDLKHFSYATSHDLQEPLRMVTMYTELLAREYKGKMNAQTDLFIGYALEGARRLDALLRDLREYWLIDEQIDRFAPLDSGLVLEKTIQALKIPIDESCARVTHGPLPIVVAEEVSLAMLLQNLLANAMKYRRAGEAPSIHVSAQKTTKGWCFAVQDNGIGIEKKYLEQIFAPFKRLHGSDYPGSGIGLALCSRIVEKYGGRLWVESTYGEGSTFYFTIPARPA